MKTIDRIVFLGSKRLGLRILEQMWTLAPDSIKGIVTIDDSFDTRSEYAEYLKFADNETIVLSTAENQKHAERLLDELKPELVISCGWYWLISTKALNSVSYGFIGIHNSLLPKLRGAAPLVWTIIQHQNFAGVSLFSMAPGLDDGPIWGQTTVPIEATDYVSNVLEKLEAKTVELFKEKFPQIVNGEAKPTEQDHQKATYCAPRMPSDGKIDWSRSACEIYDFIRAQSAPYPGAFTLFEGNPLIIWRARPFEREYWGTPGQVARISDEGVFVICGDNRAIILDEVEINKNRKNAREIIKTIKTRFPSLTK